MLWLILYGSREISATVLVPSGFLSCYLAVLTSPVPIVSFESLILWPGRLPTVSMAPPSVIFESWYGNPFLEEFVSLALIPLMLLPLEVPAISL
jgi:hypothetical protein